MPVILAPHAVGNHEFVKSADRRDGNGHERAGILDVDVGGRLVVDLESDGDASRQ